MAVNDNKQHPLVHQYMYWQERVDGFSKYPSFIHKTPFEKVDLSLSNMIWFFQFELFHRQKDAEFKRGNFEVIECAKPILSN